jgi:hypothetical protein
LTREFSLQLRSFSREERTARFFALGETRLLHVLRHALPRLAAVSDQAQAARPSAEEEAGPRRTRSAYRAVSGDAIEIERGLLFPTLPTLLRIAMVFNVGLEHFFVPATQTTKGSSDGARQAAASPAYLFESLYYPVAESKIL